MANQDGAKPFPGAPKVPGAYPTPATRPFRRSADGCFPVAMDNMIVPTLYVNESNNNSDSNNRPVVKGNPADEATMQPEGKPSA